MYSNIGITLFDSSIKGISPKETSIAFDVFGKDTNFNPNEDTTVRVNIFHLRKKLDRYYQHEGKADKIRIDIPLGHYSLKFIQNKRKLILKKKVFAQGIILSLIVLVIFLGVYLILLKRENAKLHENLVVQALEAAHHPIWETYLNSQFPTMIILGELYFFTKYDPLLKQSIMSRMHSIKSNDDLEKLQQQFPSGQFSPTQTDAPSYFAMNSVWPLVTILPIITESHQPYHLQRSLKLSPKELKENNIIFIGSYQSLIPGPLKDVSQKSSFSFDRENETIIAKAQDEEQARVYNPTNSFRQIHKDYCIVKKLPGPNKNTILIISSFSATGTSGTAKYLTNAKSLSELEGLFINQYDYFPQYFEIIFEVSGYERSHFDTNVKEYRKIDPEIDLW